MILKVPFALCQIVSSVECLASLFFILFCDRGVVAETDKSIENAVKGLGESGFINYFGLQVRCRGFIYYPL